MSWHVSLGPILKSEVRERLRDLKVDYAIDEPALAQVDAAKCAVIELVKNLPGPKVSISLSGHSNGIGYQKKDGFSNECISVSVNQFYE